LASRKPQKTIIETDRKIIQLIGEEIEFPQYSLSNRLNINYRTVIRRVKTLEDLGFIRVCKEEPSMKGGKYKKIHCLTFKGLMVVLSNCHLPELALNSGKDESIKELEETLRQKNRVYQQEIIQLEKILTKYGKKLEFPVFGYCQLLEQKIPFLYQIFIRIAKDVIQKTQSSYYVLSQKTFMDDKKNLEKKVNILTNTRFTFDSVAIEKEKLEYSKLYLETVIKKENELLEECFFMDFLELFRFFHLDLPNEHLYNYTMLWLKKEKELFFNKKQLLEKWLIVFEKP